MEAIRQRGYWLRRELVKADQVSALAAQVMAICRQHGWLEGRRGFAWDAPEFAQLQVEVQLHPQFTELREDPRIMRAAARLLGGPARAGQGDICRMLFPDGAEFTTPPHQDQYYIKRADDVWSAWIPLSDCPRERGSLAVVPGSRRWGLLPHAETGCKSPVDAPRWREFDFRGGDVLFVHSMTVHKALINRSGQLRISIDCRYAL